MSGFTLTPIDALARTGRLVADHWGQGAYRGTGEDGEPFYCLVGALRKVSGYYDYDLVIPVVYQDAKVALQAVVGNHLVRWNDEAGRTREDVLAAISEAIMRLWTGECSTTT